MIKQQCKDKLKPKEIMKKISLFISFLCLIFSAKKVLANDSFMANINNSESRGIVNVIDKVDNYGDFPKREYQIKNIYILRELKDINIGIRKISYSNMIQLYGAYTLTLESFDKATGNFVYKFTIMPMALSNAAYSDGMYRYNDDSIFLPNSHLFFEDKPYAAITGQYKLVNGKPTIIPLDATNFFQLKIDDNKLILKQSIENVPVKIELQK